MANSQFNIYTSTDSGAPVLSSASGSLIAVMDYCLISKAGWLKPIPNSGSVVTSWYGTGSACACYQQPSGSGRILVVNDGGSVTGVTHAGGRTAMVCGYESLISLAADASTVPSASMGSGSGKFPQEGQINNGYKFVTKSTSATYVPSIWMMFVDAHTFYFFLLNGEGSYYTMFAFGDVYSLSANDPYKCMIVAKNAAATGNSYWDYIACMPTLGQTLAGYNTYTDISINRKFGGGAGYYGRSIHAILYGDFGATLNSAFLGTGYSSLNNGKGNEGVFGINPINNSIYLQPLHIMELPGGGQYGYFRGRMRGFYQVCHSSDFFADGQTFNGTGDFSGKTFRIVRPGPNGGYIAIETSNTVETNS
jgi:hypothetical protein